MNIFCCELYTNCFEETQAVGRLIGSNAGPGDVLLLSGGLGAGKTCLTQGVLWGLGSEDFVRSPTFVLISKYTARINLYHMDLYRLDTVEHIEDLGIDEYLEGHGICVIEWAEKGSPLFSEEHLKIQMDWEDETSRKITLTSKSKRYEKMISQLKDGGF